MHENRFLCAKLACLVSVNICRTSSLHVGLPSRYDPGLQISSPHLPARENCSLGVRRLKGILSGARRGSKPALEGWVFRAENEEGVAFEGPSAGVLDCPEHHLIPKPDCLRTHCVWLRPGHHWSCTAAGLALLSQSQECTWATCSTCKGLWGSTEIECQGNCLSSSQ